MQTLVANAVAAVATRQPFAEILDDSPSITEADIRAFLQFACELMAMESTEA